MSIRSCENALTKLGLSDKEARVYLANLELGAATIQQIAQRAGVKRATTYVMVESLIDRGLLSTFVKGKKTLFAAESPNRLTSFIESELSDLQTKQKLLQDLLPELLQHAIRGGDRPRISYHEGTDGLKFIHEDILSTGGTRLDNLVSLDDSLKVDVSPIEVEKFREALSKKGVDVRILYSSQGKSIDLPEVVKGKWQSRRLNRPGETLHGEITVYGDKVAAFSYKDKIFGTVIESNEIAETMRVLFNIVWESIKK
jgi:HTH-type transcriptional regulator, sugar sensing transcriptional regulator